MIKTATSVGEIGLDLVVNHNQFKRQMSGITSLAKKAGAALAAAFAVKKVVEFGKECIELGSNLAEVQNVVDVTFTTMSNKVNEFADSAAQNFGLSETMAKKFTGTFGAMAKSFGFTEDQAYKMSTTLTGLSGDVASFYNITQDEAYTKLKSVFTGETETLKDLGVVMTQNALDAYALSRGINKSVEKMSEAEKVALRYNFVLDKLSNAKGDFSRTFDSWANQTRYFKLQLDSIKATIGQGLINVFKPVLKVINLLMAKLKVLAEAFKDFTEKIFGSDSNTKDNTNGYLQEADAVEDLTDAQEKLQEETKKAGEIAEGALAPFDRLNVLEKVNDKETDGDMDIDIPSIDIPTIEDINTDKGKEDLSEFQKAIEALIDRVKELANLFKDGFFEGIGNWKGKVNDILKSLKSIWNSLKDIFTDSSVLKAINKFFDALALNFGRIVGSVASIGLTIAQNLIGGMAKYLEQNKDFIKNSIVSIFNVWSEIANIIGQFSVAIADIFSVFSGDTAKQITADIIGIFANAVIGIIEVLSKLTRDMLDLLTAPIINNKDKIKEALENTLLAIEPILGSIKDLVTNTFIHINQMYDEHIKPLFDTFKNGISRLLEILLDGYNNYIAPVLQNLGNKFKDVMENHVQPAIDKIIEAIGKLADAIGKIWRELVQPFLEWCAAHIMPILAPIIELIGNGLLNAFAALADVVGFVAEVLGNFFTWLSNHQEVIVAATMVVTAFIGAWEITKLIAFVEQCGGVMGALKQLGDAMSLSKLKVVELAKEFVTLTLNKVKDKAETIALTAMYAKDFIVNIAESTRELIKHAAQIVIATAAKVKDAIAQAAMTAATVAWNGVCSIATGLTTAFGVAINFLTSPIGIVVAAIAGLIAIGVLLYQNWDTIKNKAKEIFGKIQEYLEGFARKWNEIWSTVKQVLQDVWDSIADFIRDPINKIIDAINTMIDGVVSGLNAIIRALNRIHIDVPDWVMGIGGKSFGFDIEPLRAPQIPRLADGGVIKPNREFAAILGDQKQGNNIEAPEALIRKIVREETGSQEAQNINLTLKCTGDLSALVRLLKPELEKEEKRTGLRLVDIKG